VPVHPVCHRTIHALFGNAELARLSPEALRAAAPMQRFLSWIATKPPDFHAPTARPRPDK